MMAARRENAKITNSKVNTEIVIVKKKYKLFIVLNNELSNLCE